MLLQEGVPLKTARGWKRTACVPLPMAVSQSLPVVLDLVALPLSRGGRDLSTWWCQLQRQEHPCMVFFSTVMLVEICTGQISFMMNLMAKSVS